MKVTTDDEEDAVTVGNYCVSFIDLLGQRAALRGQSLLMASASKKERAALDETLRNSIGSIASLQRRAATMMRASQPKPDSKLRATLGPDQQVLWDQMLKSNVTTQRWSDGLMSFAPLGDKQVKCHVNNVFSLFALSGSLSLLGLASKKPIRGGMEVAWGVELHPGELYGAAVARAYELESQVADYPRVVVGPEMLKYLDQQCRNTGTDPFTQANRTLALLCKDILLQDADGHYFLHYLGEAFRSAVTEVHHQELYSKARAFTLEQLSEHRAKQDTKLAFRYVHLIEYFDAHPPESCDEGDT